MLDDVSKAGCSLEQPHGWPSGWHVLDMDSIRYFNIAGPDWAALDARINPWGKLDDGLWELSVDKYVVSHPCFATSGVHGVVLAVYCVPARWCRSCIACQFVNLSS